MKKVLSFVLSVAMVICLMPAMAFADETATTTTETNTTGLSQFSDRDSIKNENKEAVAVLVGLGIIDGMGDGTFQPKGDLTRAQASKLIATLVKQGDKSDIAAPATDPFTDVAKSYWGAGAIQFGVDNGYINGMGDGTFHPEEQVTTAQLATMLCKLLGYSVEDVNYHWPENAMGYANNAGLLIDVNKGATEVLNREEAAQMIYNALLEETVMKSSVSGSDSHDVKGNTGYDPVNNKESQDYRTYGKDTLQQLIEKYFPKATYVKFYDAFGRPATVWKNGKDDMTDEVTKAPVFSYNSRQVDELTNRWPEGVATKKLKDDLDGYIAEGATIVLNGSTLGEWISRTGRRGQVEWYFNETTIDEDFSEYLANIISKYTGNGVEVELYADEKDTHITDVIIIDYDIDMVKKVSSKTGDITLDNYGTIDKKEDYYSAISTVGVGDFVLIAKDIDGAIVDAYIPTEVDGVAVTEVSSASKNGREDEVATVGGKDYSLGHDDIVYENPYGELSNYGRSLPVNAEDFGTLFLDKFNNVVAYRGVKLPDWALMTAVYRVDDYNELGEADTRWYGQLVKEDGKTDTVRLLYITDQDEPGYNTAAATSSRNIINNFRRTAANDGNNWFSQQGVLVHYVESAAGYRLYASASDSIGVNEPSTNIDKSFNEGSKAIDTYYLADTINVITVTGKKASTLQVVSSNQIKQAYDSDSYKYVAKRISGNRYLVTTIYITDSVYYNDTNKVVKVTKVLSERADGIMVRYYTDDSTEPVDMLVSNESVNLDVSSGYFFTERIEEGMFLDSNNEALNYVDYTVTKGNEDVGVKSSITLGTGRNEAKQEYKLTADATFVDLTGEGEFENISDVVEEINNIGQAEADDEVDPLHISFAYEKADDGTLFVKQIYIEK
jgi:hypothetical protein